MGRCKTTTFRAPNGEHLPIPPPHKNSLHNQCLHTAHIMGTPAIEARSRYVAFRLTEKEYIQLRAEMANWDYTSVSHFVRDRIMDRQILIRKDVVLTDRNLRNQINNLSATVAKVGVDYNQATKKFNALCKMKRADGSPVINARAANYYLVRIHKLTKDLKKSMNYIIDLVDRLDYDINKPHPGNL